MGQIGSGHVGADEPFYRTVPVLIPIRTRPRTGHSSLCVIVGMVVVRDTDPACHQTISLSRKTARTICVSVVPINGTTSVTAMELRVGLGANFTQTEREHDSRLTSGACVVICVF